MGMFDKKIDYETKCTELEHKIIENEVKMQKFLDKIGILQEELNFTKLEKSDMNDKINELGLLNFDLKNDNRKMADSFKEISDAYNKMIDNSKKLKPNSKIIEINYPSSDMYFVTIDSIIGLSKFKSDKIGHSFTIFLKENNLINVIITGQSQMIAQNEYDRIKNAIS
jgi:hypothetical protein